MRAKTKSGYGFMINIRVEVLIYLGPDAIDTVSMVIIDDTVDHAVVVGTTLGSAPGNDQAAPEVILKVA